MAENTPLTGNGHLGLGERQWCLHSLQKDALPSGPISSQVGASGSPIGLGAAGASSGRFCFVVRCFIIVKFAEESSPVCTTFLHCDNDSHILESGDTSECESQGATRRRECTFGPSVKAATLCADRVHVDKSEGVVRKASISCCNT